MNRLLIALVAAGSLASGCSPAFACQRCGLFGARCRFQSVSYSYPQAVAYAPPATTTNVIFNNALGSYPPIGSSNPVGTPLGLPQGNSVYAYSLASSAYSLDPAQVLDRSARLTEMAITGGQKALASHNDTVGGALQLAAAADRTAKNTIVALSAIQANQQQPAAAPAGNLSTSFQATIQNGRLSIKALGDPAPVPGGGQTCTCTNCTCSGGGQPSPTPTPQPGPAPTPTPGCNCGGGQPVTPTPDVPPAPQPLPLPPAPGIGGLSLCAACHDGSGAKNTPVGLALNGSTAITNDQYQLAFKSIMSGKMPPKMSLTDDQKLATIAELAKLVQQ